MKNRLRTTIALIIICLIYVTTTYSKVYKLYYLGGQSNMDGYGFVNDLPEKYQPPFEKVMIFHGNTSPDGARVDGRGIWTKLQPGHGVGLNSDGKINNYSDRFGIELSFASRMLALQPGSNIAIIKYSRGGTSIDIAAAGEFGCWDPDFNDGNGINQYDHFLATVRHAFSTEDIDGDGEEDTLIPTGILWMQGESDAAHGIDIAKRYQGNLKRLMDLIRAALLSDDLPVVIGRISDSRQDEDGSVWDFGTIVREMQSRYVQDDGYAALVTSTDQYGYSDPWHYDSKGYLDLGIQFADAVHNLEMANYQKPSDIYPDRINYLMADEAKYSSSMQMLISSEPGKERLKRFWVQNWTESEQGFQWEVNATNQGDYLIDILVSAPPGTEIKITGPNRSLKCKTMQEANRWNWHWDRIQISETINLPKGSSIIQVNLAKPLQITDKSNKTEACLKSLELVHVDFKPELDKRIQASRASTKWLRDTKFGIMLQFGEWGYPRHGDKKVWPEVVNDFDVEQFADKIASTQAGYVIWSATWRTYYFPAPIKSIDNILPGRTSKRDLIGELADALAKRGIKLMLYYHVGHETSAENGDWWKYNWVSWDDKKLFLENWSAIIKEVGERYGNKLAGWFFDDGLTYYPVPFEKLTAIAKLGYKDRIVSYNPWILPRDTDFQDVFFGEGFQWRNDLPVGGSGIFSEGPYKGLQAHTMFIVEDGSGWGIWKPDTKIKGLRYSKDEALKMALHAAERNYILSWNILMYEDGYIWEETLDLLSEIGKVVRDKYPIDKK